MSSKEKLSSTDRAKDDAYFRILPKHIIEGDYRLRPGEPDDLRLEANNVVKNRDRDVVDPAMSDAIYGEMARLRVGLEFLEGAQAEPIAYLALLGYFEQRVEEIFEQPLGDRAIYPTRLQE